MTAAVGAGQEPAAAAWEPDRPDGRAGRLSGLATRPRNSVLAALLVAVGLSAIVMPIRTTAQADPGPPQVDDELELARWADRVGDEVVLAFLAPQHQVLSRLRTIGATPALTAPHRALMPLAALAGGRDPDLAPAAARAALNIASSISTQWLQAHEVLPVQLEESLQAYRSLSEDRSLRPDIALTAVQVVAELKNLRR